MSVSILTKITIAALKQIDKKNIELRSKIMEARKACAGISEQEFKKYVKLYLKNK